MLDEETSTFLASLSSLSDPNLSEQRTNELLFKIQKDLTPGLFSSLDFSEITQYLTYVWTGLLNASKNQNSSVHLAASRTTSVFINRFMPFYTTQLQDSFSKVVQQTGIVSPLIAASFAYISTTIATPYLLQFITSANFFQQYNVTEESHVVSVSNLLHIGTYWLDELLKQFLIQFEANPNRFLIRAIAAIAMSSLSYFLPKLVGLKSLPLYSYIFSNADISDSDIDVLPFASYAIEAINNSSSNPSDLDSALQILASIDDKATINQIDDTTLVISIGEYSAELKKDRFINRPPFYLLRLPLSYLIPQENDGTLIMTSKFQTIAKIITPENKNEIIRIFSTYLKRPYDEVKSAALQGLALCVEKIDHPEFINWVVFGEIVSWFNAFDVLRVIQKLQYSEGIMKVLINFALDKNEKLSYESIQTLKVITTEETYEQVIITLALQCDFFDQFAYKRCLYLMSEIMSKFPEHEQYESFIECVIESFPQYQSDLQMMSSIFKFLSVCDLRMCSREKLIDIIHQASSIIIDYYEAISGMDWNQSQIHSKTISPQQKIIREDVSGRSFDLLVEYQIFDQYMPNFDAALSFLFSVPIEYLKRDEIIYTCTKLFQMFPMRISKYLEKSWSRFTEEHKINVLYGMEKMLQMIGDNEIYTIWCRIVLQTRASETDKKIIELASFLNVCASEFFTVPQTNHEIAATFAAFDVWINPHTIVPQYVTKLQQNQRHEFLRAFKKFSAERYQKMYETDPELFAFEEIPQTSIEKHQKQIELVMPTKEEDFVNAIEIALQLEQAMKIELLLDTAKRNNWKIDITEFNFPPNIIPILSGYIAKKYPDILSLDYALNNARTSWREAAVAALSLHPEFILEEFSRRKATKKDLYNFCSLLGFIKFNLQDLSKFIHAMLQSSKSTAKFRITLTMLAIEIALGYNISPDLLDEYVKKLNENFSILSFYRTSILLMEVFKKSQPTNLSLIFSRKICDNCGDSALEYAIFHQSLVRFKKEDLKKINRKISFDIESTASELINSSIPSRVRHGMDLSLHVKVSKTMIDVALAKIHEYVDLPFVNQEIINFLTNENWHERYRGLEQFIFTNNSQAYYGIIIQLIMYYLEKCDTKDLLYEKSRSMMSKLFEGPHALDFFEKSIEALEIALKRIPDTQSRTTGLMDVLLVWVDNLKLYDNNNTMICIKKWINVMQFYMTDSQLLSVLCYQFLKMSPRFWPMFINVAVFHKKTQKRDWGTEILKNSIQVVKNKCHKTALALLLKEGQINNAVQLAFFDRDCDESEKVITSIKI